MNNREPIGVFDSGVGGISVLRELVKVMPCENYIYMGDSRHAPYGTKSLEEVRTLTIGNVEKLLERGAKSIVVACNTATSAAVAILREKYPELPLVGIEPAIKPAVLAKQQSRIVVMATPMTVRLEKFQKLMAQYEDQAEIIPLPCPGLMEFIEQGDLCSEELRRYLTELLWTVHDRQIDSIVLGCTHYPFVRPMITEIVGTEVAIFDGGNGTAREMKRRLALAQKLTDAADKGKVCFYNSRDTEEERKLCEFLLHSGA
ncbi:MAG: glutamate racemase [Clostridiaceae bacterium]|nr:glutamate racemase [Clostridiaceae bacterium]